MEQMELERRPSVSSVGSQGKRKREEVAEEVFELEQYIVEEVIEIIMSEANKINKGVGKILLKKYQELAAISMKKGLEIAKLQGRLEERESTAAAKSSGTRTYAGVMKSSMPKVGKRQVIPKDVEKTVLIYSKDEKVTDAEVTKKIVKEVIAPKVQGIQIRAVKKINKGGIVIEAGTKSSATKIREAAKSNDRLKVAEPKRMLPRIMIYDVDKELKEEEIKEYIFKQNLEETMKKEVMKDGFTICYKTGRRDLPSVNYVCEVDPKIREVFLKEGRVYIDYDACRVVDFLHVSRCYKCQGYGHIRKNCKAAGESVCSHCCRVGHIAADCDKRGDKPSCVNCMAAKKPSDHKVGTLECPMYKRLVEQRISRTSY